MLIIEKLLSKFLEVMVILFKNLQMAQLGFTKKGINGLYDMGANVWEWADIQNKNK